MKQDTKTRILEAGAQIIHLKGFNNAGIQEILKEAGVPKGSFYHFFASKEDFGLQVIEYFADYFSALAKGVLEDASISPLERLERLLDWFIAFFKSKDYAYGCPIGNLSQEMGDLNPAFQEKLNFAIDAMAGSYARILSEARMAGDIPETLDVKEASYFVVSSWHGALIRMKVMKSSEPLENHKRFILDHVLTVS
jgi:TetR/AcrR family transcriptional repressor of nem operon